MRELRIGISQNPKEITVELADDADGDAIKADVEAALGEPGTGAVGRRSPRPRDRGPRRAHRVRRARPRGRRPPHRLRRLIRRYSRAVRSTVGGGSYAGLRGQPERPRARTHCTLDPEEIGHLQRLVRNWGLLADISFSDLLLMARVRTEPAGFVVLGHVRPTTGQTLYQRDPIGELYTEADPSPRDQGLDDRRHRRGRPQPADRRGGPGAQRAGRVARQGARRAVARQPPSVRAATQPARTHLHTGLRSLRPHDRGRRFPV